MQKRVGILRGGAGKNYNASLRRGGQILAYISEKLGEKYQPVDILIDKEGVWHAGGMPIKLSDLMHRVDMVWNVAHGNFSHSLDSLAIPHLSPMPFFSALKESPDLLREHLSSAGIHLPRSLVLPVYQEDFDGPKDKYATKKAKEVHAKFGAPWIVKSFTPDENMGIHLAKTFPELVEAIEDGVKHEKSILVEEFISGKAGALHTLSGFRKEEIYVFPCLPARTPGGYGNIFSPEEKEKLSLFARELHRHLCPGSYLKSDFLITPRQKVYLLGFENVPNLKENSHLSEVCGHIGTDLTSVIEHMLEKTLRL